MEATARASSSSSSAADFDSSASQHKKLCLGLESIPHPNSFDISHTGESFPDPELSSEQKLSRKIQQLDFAKILKDLNVEDSKIDEAVSVDETATPSSLSSDSTSSENDTSEIEKMRAEVKQHLTYAWSELEVSYDFISRLLHKPEVPPPPPGMPPDPPLFYKEIGSVFVAKQKPGSKQLLSNGLFGLGEKKQQIAAAVSLLSNTASALDSAIESEFQFISRELMSLRRNNWTVNLKQVKEGFGGSAVGNTKRIVVGFGYQNAGSYFNYPSEAELVRVNKASTASSSSPQPPRHIHILFPPSLNTKKELRVSLSSQADTEFTANLESASLKNLGNENDESEEAFERNSLHDQLKVAQEVVFNEELYQKLLSESHSSSTPSLSSASSFLSPSSIRISSNSIIIPLTADIEIAVSFSSSKPSSSQISSSMTTIAHAETNGVTNGLVGEKAGNTTRSNFKYLPWTVLLCLQATLRRNHERWKRMTAVEKGKILSNRTQPLDFQLLPPTLSLLHFYYLKNSLLNVITTTLNRYHHMADSSVSTKLKFSPGTSSSISSVLYNITVLIASKRNEHHQRTDHLESRSQCKIDFSVTMGKNDIKMIVINFGEIDRESTLKHHTKQPRIDKSRVGMANERVQNNEGNMNQEKVFIVSQVNMDVIRRMLDYEIGRCAR